MTSENFKYWLNGYFEISNTYELNKDQYVMIKNHLKIIKDSDNFIHYLNGIFDSNGDKELSLEQCKLIFDKLNKEFKKITPDFGNFDVLGNIDFINKNSFIDDTKLC